MPNQPFPGVTLSVGSSDRQSTLLVQQRLAVLGCGPVTPDGVFGAETFAAVEIFQARSVDSTGHPLAVDGMVGPSTWAALFGNDTVVQQTAADAPTALLRSLLTIAAGEVGVMESPLGSNRGPKVDQYIRATGLDPAGHYAWCACFVYWCFKSAAAQQNVPNPCFRTAGVVEAWNGANGLPSARRILPAEAVQQPSLIVPGTLFLLHTSGPHGHMGIIESVQGNQLTTIEGNTNAGGSPDGIGVFRRTARRINLVNLGFILYS